MPHLSPFMFSFLFFSLMSLIFLFYLFFMSSVMVSDFKSVCMPLSSSGSHIKLLNFFYFNKKFFFT